MLFDDAVTLIHDYFLIVNTTSFDVYIICAMNFQLKYKM